MAEESKVIGKRACEKCREKGGDHDGDNQVVYSDGHTHCFACNTTIQPHSDGHGKPLVSSPPPRVYTKIPILKGMIPNGGLPHRRISQDTCLKYDYRVARFNDVNYEVANYFDGEGNIQGQKLRGPEKRFCCTGDMSVDKCPLFGQHLWKGGGKRIVVTEGEIDCLSIAEIQNCQWPVVSIPNGSSGAAAAFKRNLEFLDGYEQVIICFDSDDPGKKAAVEAALVLKPGKASIVALPRKDANEMLMADEARQLASCLWEAKPYRPDGVVHVSEVKADSMDIGLVLDYPWDSLTSRLWGRRGGELCMHTSGSGMGKTTVLREMLEFDLRQGKKVGVMMLEESNLDTMNALIALKLGKPIHKILASRKINSRRIADGKKPLDFKVTDNLTDEEYAAAKKELSALPLYLYDHFGSLECDTLMQKMEYMSAGLGCEVIYLDHISIVISGKESTNERKDIDVLMTKLASFVERGNTRVEAVCHLTKPEGTPFEEGGQISLRDLRGSGGLYQLSNSVIGYERDQQSLDALTANTIMVRSLKDRFSGYTGLVGALRYDHNTTRLKEIPWAVDPDGKISFGITSGDPLQEFEDESQTLLESKNE